MNRTPLLSVIIPTHNRSGMLATNLKALSQQTFPVQDFEVLVVADACQDDTGQVVADLAPELPYKFTFLSHSAGSPGVTRNLGAAQAVGGLLLFLDDDVIPQPGLVQAHWAAQVANRVVLGYSRPVIPDPPSFWQYNARLWWEDTYRAMSQPGYRFGYRDFFSGNVSMPAALFNKAGRFDANIKVRLEDYELGFRLIKDGAELHFAPDAIGFHFDETDLKIWLRRVYKEGIADIQIGQRHPELRNILFADHADLHEDWGRLKWMIRKAAFAWTRPDDPITSIGLLVAKLCERLRLRGPWFHLIGALREYNYWRGAAWRIGGHWELVSWLQDAPPAPCVMLDAPVIDLGIPETLKDLQLQLGAAQSKGLRVAWQGAEVLTIAPKPGHEPLRLDHIQAMVRQKAQREFVPGLALSLAHSSDLRVLQWQSS